MHDLAAYWSADELYANGIIILHLGGALLLGIAIGYERSYSGHAAGMRTYALVCVASTLVTVPYGFAALWYGGGLFGPATFSPATFSPATLSPAQVIQGIMTGIGFLGAGVIMREGMTIRGLSTAASVWITAAIGIAVGIGFYGAAIAAALIVIVVMSAFRRLEDRLAHHTELRLTVSYGIDQAPTVRALEAQMQRHDMTVTGWSYHRDNPSRMVDYEIIVRSYGSQPGESLTEELMADGTIIAFRLSPTRS